MSESIVDPSNRYLRCEVRQKINRTTIYKCLDQEESSPADWYEISLENMPPETLQNLKVFMTSFSQIKHPNILQISRAWLDSTRKTLVYVTEVFSRKTLRIYLTELAQRPAMSVISKWCIQILNGLSALHNAVPPIIHNDLTCNNIYIDVNTGIIKIGIPSFEAVLFNWISPYASLEVQRGVAEPRSDVWALGLCVIEMATGEQPYADKSAPRDAILRGESPAAVGQVSDPSVADFITCCLLPVDLRPSTQQLFETALISENYEPPPADPEPSAIQQLQAKQKSEYDSLLARQELERKELIQRIKAKIRANNQKQASFRDLLKS